ncbi:cadherin-like domain-containing protein [Myxococcus sp. K38C18041901]|uniref:Ig-like domain-containing protein n=1 Tax=Myxococcus guangdongensis TaxID=2906760 RepID=UPI0020A79E1F|nr:Ig-like domain-containing protein [Myxococcus guangdongensis]MCP3060051.1 cadherin-like domain-containing protein [Myxococcus guangdongensis]
MWSSQLRTRAIAAFVLFLGVSGVQGRAWGATPQSGPVLSTERPVGATRSGPAHLTQYESALAWGTSNYLAAWVDFRHGIHGEEGHGTQVYATRLSASGEVLDAAGIRLSTGAHVPHYQQGISIAADSTGFLVAWQDASLDGNTVDPLLGTRVGADGQVVWAGKELIRPRAGTSTLTRLAFTGDGYLLVWNERTAEGRERILASRVELDGTVLDPTGVDVGVGSIARMTWTPQGGLLLYWSQGIWGIRVNARGEAQGSAFRINAPDVERPGSPQVAFDGTNHLVVWTEPAPESSGEDKVLGARVSPTQGVLGAPFFIHDAPTYQSFPQVAFNGTNYVVTWQDDEVLNGARVTSIYARRLSPSGVVLDAESYLVRRNPGNVALFQEAMAASGTDILVTWHSRLGDLDDALYASRMDSTGAPLPDPLLVSSASNTQLSPAMASGGEHHLVVWTEPNALPQGSDIFGTFVDDAGIEVTPGGFAITQSAQDQQHPAVAFDGTHFLVTWTETVSTTTTYVMARRIPAFGAPVKPEFRINAFATTSARPKLACVTKTCLVAWYDPSSNPSSDAITSNYVNPNDDVLPRGASAELVGRGPLEKDLSVSTSGAHFLVVYSSGFNTGTNTRRVEGRLVATTSGQPGTNSFPISEAASGMRSPSAAFDGTNHVVAWMEGSQVRATRVSVGGTVLETTPWEMSPVESSLEQRPTVVSDGISSLVLWASRPPEGSTLNTIHGTRTMAFDSTPGTPQVLAAAPWSDTFAAGTSMKPGQFLVAYSRFEGPPHGTHRLFTRKARYNTAPQVTDRSHQMVEDRSLDLSLTARDVENDAFTLSISAGPTHGAVRGTPPDVTYTPTPGFRGEDSFQFTATDTEGMSSTATVRVTVIRAPVAPQAVPLDLELDEDTTLSFRLMATDENGDAVTYRVGPPPLHGTLMGTPPDLQYTPHADFNGTDTFEYLASDGTLESARVRVTITVRPIDDAPVAEDSSYIVDRWSSVEILLKAHDVDGDALTYSVAQPRNGTLTGTAPNLVYTPFPNAREDESIVFTVSDGKRVATGTVTIDVRFQNVPPFTQDQRLAVTPGESIDIELDVENPDGDALTYVITEQPASGTLSGEPPHLRFQASDSFTGEVSFTYVASDGLDSATGRVFIRSLARPAAPSPGKSGGCSSSGGAPSLVLVLGVLALLARRHRGYAQARVTKHRG